MHCRQTPIGYWCASQNDITAVIRIDPQRASHNCAFIHYIFISGKWAIAYKGMVIIQLLGCDLIELLTPTQHCNADTSWNAPPSASTFTDSQDAQKCPREASRVSAKQSLAAWKNTKQTNGTFVWAINDEHESGRLTWSRTRRCTAGRSRRSSGEAGQDRSEAWPWSSTAGSSRNMMGWAPTRWAGWSVPPRSGRWPRNASSYLWSAGER